jgi:protein transport protein HofC
MFAVVVCALLCWLWVQLQWGLIFGAIFLVIPASIAIAVILVRKSSSQHETLLNALAIAAERSLPLAPAALAFADQFGRSFRNRVQLLATLLNEGAPLPAAIDQVPSLMSRDSQVLVRTGWESGTLPHSLRDAAALRATIHAAWGSIAARYTYLVGLVLSLQTIVTFLMYFIIPKFEAIFKDFGLGLPVITVATIHVSHALVKYAPVTFLLVLLEAALLLLLPLGLFNVTRWNIPFLDSWLRRRHTALVLRGLALTVEGGKPISTGLSILARDYPSSWVRRRLRLVRDDVEHGRDWVESLQDYGLIRSADNAVLASAQRAGNLAWALREMADLCNRRLGYKLQFWLQLLFPLAMIALGVIVFFLAVAFFSPLVMLIEALAG